MKKYFLTYLICSFFCVLTIPSVAQETCEDAFETICKLHEQKNWKAAQRECQSYLRHCGSRAQVEQILKECDKQLDRKAKPKQQQSSKPAANKRLSVSEKNLEFPESGGKKTIAVTAGGAWDIYNYPGWLDVYQQNNTLIISCGTNYYASAREDDVVLVDEYLNEVHITIFQDKNTDYLRLSANLIDNPGDGGVYTVKVNSNKLWRVKNYLYWCNVETSGNDIRITLDKNNSGYERKGEIEVVSQSGSTNLRSVITVKQSVLKNYLTLSSSSFNDPTGRGCVSQPIKVETDRGNFSIYNVPTWCEIVNRTSSSFSIKIQKNCGGGERNGQFKVVAGDMFRMFAVSQVARPKYVDVNPDATIVATKRGGRQTYTVNTNCGPWRVVNLPDWCRLDEQTSNYFTITILPNEGASRSATFAVSSSGERCNMTVKQE